MSLGSTNALQYDGQVMITGGSDRKLKVWNVGSVSLGTLSYKESDYKPDILNGHYGEINCLQFDRSVSKLVTTFRRLTNCRCLVLRMER